MSSSAIAPFLACAVVLGCSTSPVEARSSSSSAPKAAAESAAKAKAAPSPRHHDSELGRAVAAVESDPRAAASSLDALAKKMPWLDDVLAYYAAMARGRYDRAAGRRGFEAFLNDHNGSILFADATAELALLTEADGDVERTLALAERYGRGGEDGESAAAGVCLAAGRLLASRDASRAASYLQCARTKAPLSNSARAAYDVLLELRRDNPQLRPSDAQGLYAEARLLAREGRTAEQVATLRELLTRHPGSPSEAEAVLAYGRALAKSDSKAAGADFFEKKAEAAAGARKAKLLYEAATLRWNDDRNAEARKLFERMLALKTGIGDEQQALYALARISDAEGRRADAISYFGRAASAAKGAVRADSQWRQGWVSYRAKDYDTAAKGFASMAASATRGSDTDGRSEALYWQGRSLERLG
ncbi:MAG: hypothetical protein ABR538_16145, partial [Candidatus Binatia bacterium]